MTKTSDATLDLDDKVVLITGGTGTFGRRFAETVLSRWRLRKLIILSRDEHKQFDMQHEPPFRDHDAMRFFIGDVRDERRLRMAMLDVDIVIHTAALKHVSLAEYNPFECIHTNVYGAENVVSAAIECGVTRVVALSTDKAVNPINIYGASKLAADKIFVAANALAGKAGTRFSVVRYGNVLGSRGSVIPYFRRLIAEGAKSIPLTDARMTRFWIALDRGIEFTLSTLAAMQGGEVFICKIPSMRLTDMIDAIAPDLPTHVIGIRPGEKLHEVLIPEDETADILDMGDHYVICPPRYPLIAEHHVARGGVAVPKGFRYTSDANDRWLTADELQTLLAESGV